MKVSDINWNEWMPTEEAVISYLIKGDKVLLIHKKKGLGAGKVNAPGGHIEEGETPLEAAVRETREEVGLESRNLRFAGELHFHFLDGLRLKGTVYTGREFDGVPTESDEALPFWCPIGAIPWDKMWEDDIHWLPEALKEDACFIGHFIFDGDTMVDRDIKFYESN